MWSMIRKHFPKKGSVRSNTVMVVAINSVSSLEGGNGCLRCGSTEWSNGCNLSQPSVFFDFLLTHLQVEQFLIG